MNTSGWGTPPVWSNGARFSLDLLAEGDAACEQQVDIVARRLDSLAEYDPALTEVAALLQSAQAELAGGFGAAPLCRSC